MNYVKIALACAGGAGQVAKAFHVSRQAVSKWSRNGKVPPGRIIGLCELAHWCVTPNQLDEKLYPGVLDGVLVQEPKTSGNFSQQKSEPKAIKTHRAASQRVS